ncbi:hypothetical protein J7L13_03885 [bacterium]|nr:hypothetical protein [bacterium]
MEREIRRSVEYVYVPGKTTSTTTTTTTILGDHERLYRYYSNLSQRLMTKLKVLESERNAYKQLADYLRDRLGKANATAEELVGLLEEQRSSFEHAIIALTTFLGLLVLVLLVIVVIQHRMLKEKSEIISQLINKLRRS